MIKNRGFTLIELVVSMAIIAILAAAGLSSFTTSQIKGRDGRRKSDLNQLSRALELYYNDHHLYPSSSADGKVVGCTSPGYDQACAWGTGPFGDSNATIYMQTLAKDPTPSRQYYYYSSASTYALYSWLENNNDAAIITPAVSTDCDSGAGTHACSYGISSSNTKP